MDILTTLIVAWVSLEVLYLLLKLSGILPRFRLEYLTVNGRNNGYQVKLSTKISSNQSRYGVFVQEVIEFYKNGTITQRLLKVLSRRLQQRTEYWGKAAECVISVREGFLLDPYVETEASSLKKNYPQFKEEPLQNIKENIKQYMPRAEEWINKNHKMLEREYSRMMRP